ncbi:MAG: ATP-binding protein [Thermomicrobiales bacterium]
MTTRNDRRIDRQFPANISGFWDTPGMDHSRGEPQSSVQHDDAAAFGARFRAARLAAHMSQEDLAAASGVSIRAISDLELGVTRQPRASSLALLADALGFTPAERERFVVAARARLLAPAQPPLAPLAPPAAEAPILGRDEELAAIEQALASGARLVTLVGIGGIGKTRIAREIAERRAASGACPVAWTALADLVDPEGVLPAAAQSFGLDRSAGTAAGIAAALAGRSALLALDNLEHLIDAATAIADLLRAAPGLAILATSREALRIAGEHTFAIDPLRLPGHADSPGEVAANPAISLSLRGLHRPAAPAGLDDAARVVRLLDGLPLAIELAAAQTATMPPSTIANVLERSGLAALTAGRRDGPARFQTMEAALAWSTDLLPMPAVQLLYLLGAFRGGFTIEAIAGVAAALGAPDLVDWLPMLTNVHLVQRQPGAEERFTMLEPVRMFALARLRQAGALAAARQAHASWFTRWARAQAGIVDGPDPLPALDALDADLANLRLALETASQSGDPENALITAVSLSRYWEQRGHIEDGRVVIAAAIAAAGPHAAPSDALMNAIFQAGYVAELQRRFDEGDAARARLGALAAASGSTEFEARAVLLDALRALGSPERAHEAGPMLQHVRDIARPDPKSVAYWAATMLLGSDLHERDDPAAALPLLEEAIDLIAAGGSALDLPIPLARLGFALLELGRTEEANARFLEAATMTGRLGMGNAAIFPLLGLGRAAALGGDAASLARAMVIFGFTDSQIERSGEIGSEYVYSPFWDAAVADSRASAEAVLSPARVQDLTDEGRVLPLSAVLAIARG